ncbi:MAG: hypothetical protein AAGA03_18895, partial [Planctomycetota bacterium]
QAIDRPKAVLVDGPNRVLAWEELAGDIDPGAAVYVIADQDGPLYVGETLDLAARTKRIQKSAAWQRWQPKTVHVYLRPDLRQRWQLRADLIDLHQPLLNLPIWSVDVDADSQVQQLDAMIAESESEYNVGSKSRVAAPGGGRSRERSDPTPMLF